MPRKPVIGVMGGGVVGDAVAAQAESIGAAIARRGWVLLTGGRDAGVMRAASRGARAAEGLVVGVLPGTRADDGVAPGVDVAVFTGMGDARNAINVRSSDVVIALPGGAGTLSEIALAVKSGVPVVLLGVRVPAALVDAAHEGRILEARDVDEAVRAVGALLSREE